MGGLRTVNLNSLLLPHKPVGLGLESPDIGPRRTSSHPACYRKKPNEPARTNPIEKEDLVVIVAGHVVVDPTERDDYLSGCVEVVRQARQAPGCLDFSLTADLIEPGRINIFERWESQAAVEAFRGSGPSDEQGAAIVSAAVAEYDVSGHRSLT